MDGDDVRRVMTHRAEAVGIVFDRVDGDDVVPERGETMRQPAAAGTEIEDRARLTAGREHVAQQMPVGLAPDFPVSSVRVVVRYGRQQPVVLGGRGPSSLALAHGAVLAGERLQALHARRGEKAPDPVATFV